MNNNNIVITEDLKKEFISGDKPLEVLKGVSLTVQKGEIIAIVGESGSGKSTLLNLIGGIDNPTGGKIIVDGYQVHRMSEDKLATYRNKIVSFIFQFHFLLMDFTALENVAIPYLAYRYNKKEAFNIASELLNDVNLSDRLHHKPSQLSGGEQQRVALARALINKPKVILADEPTGNLDEKNSSMVCDILWGLRTKYNISIILVTHDQTIANKADQKLILDYGIINQT